MKLRPTDGGEEDIPREKDLGFWRGYGVGIALGFAIGMAVMLFAFRCVRP